MKNQFKNVYERTVYLMSLDQKCNCSCKKYYNNIFRLKDSQLEKNFEPSNDSSLSLDVDAELQRNKYFIPNINFDQFKGNAFSPCQINYDKCKDEIQKPLDLSSDSGERNSTSQLESCSNCESDMKLNELHYNYDYPLYDREEKKRNSYWFSSLYQKLNSRKKYPF